MQAGRVTTLLVIDSNPVFTAPGFAEALARVPLSMTLADGPTETAAKTHLEPARPPQLSRTGAMRARTTGR